MLKRINNLIRGFFSLFISGIEKQSPEALLEVEKENLRSQISKFNQGLATHAGVVETLIAQVKKSEKAEKELKAKVMANINAGNNELAGELALKLQEVNNQQEDTRSQLEDAEKHYKELIHARDVSVKEAKQKIEDLRKGIDDLKVKKAVAELNEMASGMINDIGGSGDNLNRLEGIVEGERAKAAGRARVAKDSIDMSDINMKQSEQDALAAMALAEFASKEGVEVKNTTP